MSIEGPSKMEQSLTSCRYFWRHAGGVDLCDCENSRKHAAATLAKHKEDLSNACVFCDKPLLEATTAQPCNHSLFHFSCWKAYHFGLPECPVCMTKVKSIRYKSPTTGQYLTYSVAARDIRSIHAEFTLTADSLTEKFRIDIDQQLEIKDTILSELREAHPELPIKPLNEIFAQLSRLVQVIDAQPLGTPERQTLVAYMFQLLSLPAFPGIKAKIIQAYLNRKTEGWKPKGRKVLKVLDVMADVGPGLDMSNSSQRIMYSALQIEYDGTKYDPGVEVKEVVVSEVKYVPGALIVE